MRRLVGAMLAFWMCLPAPAAAQAGDLRICNESDVEMRVARLARWRFFIDDIWDASGWRPIQPGHCQVFSSGPRLSTLNLLSINYMREDGREVADYGVVEAPRNPRRTGAYPIERFYCVSDEPYDRRGNSLEDFTTCRAGEYLQLFNQLVYVEGNTEYTLTLE